MPMSPRLLRPRAAGNFVTDADARAYIEAVRIADGGQYMEPAVQLAIDAFVAGCKADGIWTPIKAACILMGARTLAGALTPLVGTAPTNNGPFVSGDYNRETGLVGDGVGKYLDSNRNVNADPQDSQHMAVYASAVQNELDKAFMGAGGTATGSTQFSAVGDLSGNLQRVSFRSRNSTFSLVNNAAVAGLIGQSRASGASYSTRSNGATTNYGVSSQSPHNGNILVFARNSNLNVAALFSSHRFSFYSIGESLDLALLDTRITTLYNAIGAAI